MEDAELDTRSATETLPAHLDAYRNHPLYGRAIALRLARSSKLRVMFSAILWDPADLSYALERHLKKYECIHPKLPILGYCRGEPVYPRSHVHVVGPHGVRCSAVPFCNGWMHARSR